MEFNNYLKRVESGIRSLASGGLERMVGFANKHPTLKGYLDSTRKHITSYAYDLSRDIETLKADISGTNPATKNTLKATALAMGIGLYALGVNIGMLKTQATEPVIKQAVKSEKVAGRTIDSRLSDKGFSSYIPGKELKLSPNAFDPSNLLVKENGGGYKVYGICGEEVYLLGCIGKRNHFFSTPLFRK